MQIFVRAVEGSTLTVETSPLDDLVRLSSHVDKARERLELVTLRGRRLICGGHQLSNEGTLVDQGVCEGCTLVEVGTLKGGGCDGGTTALQRKFMSQATNTKKEEERNKEEEKRAKWTMCAASGEPLQNDILGCDLGYLFNKETILKKLALRKETPLHKNFAHISKRSHLFAVKLEANPDYDSFAGSATRIDTTFASRYICPITKRPANGVTPFVCFKPCGHAVSEQCVKHMKSSEGDTTCVICATPYNKDTDMVVLNPPAETLPEKRKAILDKQAAEKAAAKADKLVNGGKKREADGENTESRVDKAAKKAKLFELAGAGAKIGNVHGKLSTAIDLSKKGGAAAHAARASKDANYASLFKQDRKGEKEYDAAWGQGAMAGVLGSR